MDYALNNVMKWMIQSGWNLNSSEILSLSWIPASLAKFRSIMTDKRWRYHFPIISQWELLVAWQLKFWSSLPRNLISATPLMLYIKCDQDWVQDWPTGLSDIHVWKCKYIRNLFGAQGHVTPKWLTDPAGIRTRSWFYACPVYPQVWRRSDKKWTC